MDSPLFPQTPGGAIRPLGFRRISGGAQSRLPAAIMSQSQCPLVLERFQVKWNRSRAATAARRSSGAPAQARTLGSAAVSEKNLERFRSQRNRSRTAGRPSKPPGPAQSAPPRRPRPGSRAPAPRTWSCRSEAAVWCGMWRSTERPCPVNAGSAPDGPCFVGCRPHPLGAMPQTPLFSWGLGPMAPRSGRGAGCNPVSREADSLSYTIERLS